MARNQNCLGCLMLLCVGFVLGQISNNLDLDGIKKSIQDNSNFSDVKKQLEEGGLNVPDLSNTSIDPQKIENVLREKCQKENASGSVDALKSQQEEIKNCLSLYLNSSEIQTELEEAKKTGSMDEVFAKYCNKWPNVYKCFDTASETVRTCLNQQEEGSFNKTLDIVQELQEFVCHKDGDRLALFVAEGGLECLREKQEEIKTCANSTFGERIPETDDISGINLFTVLFKDHGCEDFDSFRNCIKVQLEQCSDTTPANIVDATFKFVRRQLLCDEESAVLKTDANTLKKEGSSAAHHFSSLVSLCIAVAVVFRF
ncbi:27 kDa glycoprotein-like [Euwallacea fornicatus]|uniref:27 kDa glycoprotein-like n=1 Tax=Euwallacea fornicatus TaxID=995702 RepID=UPI00338F6955